MMRSAIGILFMMMLVLIPAIVMPADEEGGIVLSAFATASPAPNEDWKDAHHAIWLKATAYPILLNRTPPLFSDGPFDDGERPNCTVRLLRLAPGDVAVQVHWTDAAENLFAAGKRYPDGGSEHIYKSHTEETDQFSDALCIMVPKQRGPHAQYPSIMMGDIAQNVDLYFWQAGRGFSLLSAHGRASTAATTETIEGTATRDEEGWTVVLHLSGMTMQTPVCFAVWDGVKGHRDGLKYFSLWYEIQ